MAVTKLAAITVISSIMASFKEGTSIEFDSWTEAVRIVPEVASAFAADTSLQVFVVKTKAIGTRWRREGKVVVGFEITEEVVNSRRSYFIRIAIARISLDLVKVLDVAKYFLLFSFFDLIQKITISIAVEPSAAVTVFHILSSSPFLSSFFHPQKEPWGKTAVTAPAIHRSTTSQLDRLGAATATVNACEDWYQHVAFNLLCLGFQRKPGHWGLFFVHLLVQAQPCARQPGNLVVLGTPSV